MVKKIKLKPRGFSLVDSDLFDYLNQFTWHLQHGYAAHRKMVKGKTTTVYMHRLVNQTPKGIGTDHINRDGLDNRRSNLRVATIRQNGMNTGLSRQNKSGFKGVCWDKRNERWRPTIKLHGKVIYLGSFKSIKEAALAYDKAAIKHFGEFAYVNL